jgi:hypothetical protein
MNQLLTNILIVFLTKGKNMQFFNTADDCEWLRKVYLGGRTDYKFESFILYGSEDSPNKVDLYFTENPLVTDDFHTINFI